MCIGFYYVYYRCSPFHLSELSVGAAPEGSGHKGLSDGHFLGCLENLLYNDLNLVELLKHNSPQVTVLGNVTFSCPDPAVVAVTFSSPQSFLQLPGATASWPGALSAGLQFRTWNRAGLLLTFEIPQRGGVVWLYLSEARLRLQVHKAGRTLVELSTGSGLNDGQWHSVQLGSAQGRLTIAVDQEEGGTAQARLAFPVTTGSHLFFGGCPAEETNQECRNPFNVFQGCMRLLTLENQLIDLIVVQQRLLGNYSHLYIDMCGIIDRPFGSGNLLEWL
ncbi:unnamed protein product [Boreogadus saida]